MRFSFICGFSQYFHTLKVDIPDAFPYQFKHCLNDVRLTTLLREAENMFMTTRLLGLLLNAENLRGKPVGENQN